MTDSQDPIPETVRNAAIDWWLRQNERKLSRREQREFDAWFANDVHRRAFEKFSGVCGFLETKLPGAGPVRKAKRRRRRVVAATGAAIALFLLRHDIELYVTADHSTGVAQTKTIALEDGSRIELDGRSAVSLRYGAVERRVTLLEGQAWFEVAADPKRPFVVEAAGGTITALGTAFDISLDGRGAQVTVTEHRVSVASGGASLIVEEGQHSAFAENAKAQAPEKVDIDKATAWRRGRLIFSNRPLGDVVEALGRYHHGYVVFVDPLLRARRVSGVFLTDEPLAAFDELETSLGLRVTRLSNYLILLR